MVPFDEMTTGTCVVVEVVEPRTRTTLRVLADPFAAAPAVLTVSAQGLMMILCPTASGEPAAKVEV
jgi:hypothetical protein